MTIVTNFNELKRLRDAALVGGAGSRAWIDFAVTMCDSFPALYDTALRMNERFLLLDGWKNDGDGQIPPAMSAAGRVRLEELGVVADFYEVDEVFRAMVTAIPAAPAGVPEFTAPASAALLWVLYHHQGYSSKVGQPIRFALGMGKGDRLSVEQISAAKSWAELHEQPKATDEAVIDTAPDDAVAKQQRDKLLGVLKEVEKWLAGWASAEPYLTIIRDAITAGEEN